MKVKRTETNEPQTLASPATGHQGTFPSRLLSSFVIGAQPTLWGRDIFARKYYV